MGQAATGKAFVRYLTYGSRTANRTDSLYQTVSGLVGNADWGESLTVAAYDFPGLNTNIPKDVEFRSYLKPEHRGITWKKAVPSSWMEEKL